MERDKLPFRKNCEGYFFNDEGMILAKKSEDGYIIFPGGGVDEEENVQTAMIRETKEETGANIDQLRYFEIKQIIWGKDWAKSEKQKTRYYKFQGDEMHFFTGKVTSMIKPIKTEEDYWSGNKFMKPNVVINIIENEIKNFTNKDGHIKQRVIQLRLLKKLIQDEK